MLEITSPREANMKVCVSEFCKGVANLNDRTLAKIVLEMVRRDYMVYRREDEHNAGIPEGHEIPYEWLVVRFKPFGFDSNPDLRKTFYNELHDLVVAEAEEIMKT